MSKSFMTKLKYVQANQSAFNEYCRVKKIQTGQLSLLKQRTVIHNFCSVSSFKDKRKG